ncbi:MAG: GyrI-like domain-containing protein [Candidatus Marinimicrobia bacterium]|nr:GyrI-like domain-containing protein [Candidatus Neomarinimicrobiota bacterium]
MKTKLVLLLAIIFLMGCGKKFEEYEYLSDPQISEKAPQKMLVYEAKGDPNETVGEAFGALISTFFKLKKAHDMDMVAPRARWPKSADTPKDQWVGIYAMPMAETVTEIPAEILSEHPALILETWEYGLVAEILHKGSYTSEGPTVERLHQFITDSGYEIAGLHEEEYLKGPGMFGPGNPDKYYTIIRYPVARIVPPVEEPSTEAVEVEETEG